jgi:hypothetical protein
LRSLEKLSQYNSRIDLVSTSSRFGEFIALDLDLVSKSKSQTSNGLDAM